MEIVFQSHRAVVSDHMRAQAHRALTKLGARLSRAIDALVRFEEDGPLRRVEIVLRAPKNRRLIASGEARFFGPALATAVTRLEAQAREVKREVRSRTRPGRPPRPPATGAE